jgi:hypothetical protein
VPYLISDLQAILHQEMGKLEKSTTTAPYIRLKTRLEELRGDPRFNFLFSGMLVGDTMVDVLAHVPPACRWTADCDYRCVGCAVGSDLDRGGFALTACFRLFDLGA